MSASLFHTLANGNEKLKPEAPVLEKTPVVFNILNLGATEKLSSATNAKIYSFLKYDHGPLPSRCECLSYADVSLLSAGAGSRDEILFVNSTKGFLLKRYTVARTPINRRTKFPAVVTSSRSSVASFR